jgi:hypothetical protein
LAESPETIEMASVATAALTELGFSPQPGIGTDSEAQPSPQPASAGATAEPEPEPEPGEQLETGVTAPAGPAGDPKPAPKPLPGPGPEPELQPGPGPGSQSQPQPEPQPEPEPEPSAEQEARAEPGPDLQRGVDGIDGDAGGEQQHEGSDAEEADDAEETEEAEGEEAEEAEEAEVEEELVAGLHLKPGHEVRHASSAEAVTTAARGEGEDARLEVTDAGLVVHRVGASIDQVETVVYAFDSILCARRPLGPSSSSSSGGGRRSYWLLTLQTGEVVRLHPATDAAAREIEHEVSQCVRRHEDREEGGWTTVSSLICLMSRRFWLGMSDVARVVVTAAEETAAGAGVDVDPELEDELEEATDKVTAAGGGLGGAMRALLAACMERGRRQSAAAAAQKEKDARRRGELLLRAALLQLAARLGAAADDDPPGAVLWRYRRLQLQQAVRMHPIPFSAPAAAADDGSGDDCAAALSALVKRPEPALVFEEVRRHAAAACTHVLARDSGFD